ncbi:MAG: hypothetical protein LVQ95_04165 [Candidatus Micrarchaeales archaeon]|nr:hypothetical protein [Candidatus Micrarchaeales archaeon]
MTASDSRSTTSRLNPDHVPAVQEFRRKISIYPESMDEVNAAWSMMAHAREFIEGGSSKRDEKVVFRAIAGMDAKKIYQLMTSSSSRGEPVISCTGGLHSTTSVFAQIFLFWWNESAVLALPGKEDMKKRGAVLLDRLMLLFDNAGLTAPEQLEILNTEMTLRRHGIGQGSNNSDDWILCGTKTLLELMTPPGTVESKEDVDVNWPQLAAALAAHQERLISRVKRTG